MAEREVEVFVHLGDEELLAGRLWSHRRGNTESATFRYDPDYLGHPYSYELDPLLPKVDGPLHTPSERKLFGAFTDSAPDRWGRRLIDRDERHRVEAEGGARRNVGEIEYVLYARDDLRQGALRFRDPERGVFLADTQDGVPYFLELSDLLTAAAHLERDEATIEEVRVLIRGGSSLGGARPKAHVINAADQIAIAKFPSLGDEKWPVIPWEAVALDLAVRGGINVPAHNLYILDDKPVLVVNRFDRNGALRIGYASAMTMLEATAGAQRSYVEIAEAIETYSEEPTADLRELWRRITFSILISNTDDHLRNHGFLRTSTAGWSLSPAFDLNPDPSPGRKHLSTAIESDTLAAIEPLLEAAPYFRLKAQDALAIIREVADATSTWDDIAKKNGLSKGEIADMAPAFKHEQAEIARRLPVR